MSLAGHFCFSFLRATLNLFFSQTPRPDAAACSALPVQLREIAPAVARTSPRRLPGVPEIDSVTGELISGNMAALVRGSYFGLENSRTRILSSSRPSGFLSRPLSLSLSCPPCLCETNQIGNLTRIPIARQRGTRLRGMGERTRRRRRPIVRT